MHLAGGFVWFAVGGGWTALVWLIGAAVFAPIIGGKPLSRAAVEMAGFSMSPFGRDAVHIRTLGGQDPAPATTAAGPVGFGLNLLWMLTFGLLLAIAYLILGALCCLTVRGACLGCQCFRLAGLSLWPVGRRVISTDLATVPRQQAAVERFARARLQQSNRDDHQGDAPSATAR